MAKAKAVPNAEVQEPEAIPVPETPVVETVLPTQPGEDTVPDLVEEEGLRTYRANWRLDGLTDEPLTEGDTIEADPDAVADLVAAGVLSLVSAEAEEGGKP